MQNDAPQQPVDPTQNYRPEDLEITDPLGNPLPEDHPARKNPQVGRPFSKGDLTLPENQPGYQAPVAAQTATQESAPQPVQPVQPVQPIQPAEPVQPQPSNEPAPQP